MNPTFLDTKFLNKTYYSYVSEKKMNEIQCLGCKNTYMCLEIYKISDMRCPYCKDDDKKEDDNKSHNNKFNEIFRRLRKLEEKDKKN